MTRPPIDTISQRTLMAALRLAIDTRQWSMVNRLADENPHAVQSHYVTYNLGKRRLALLTEHRTSA